MVRCRELFSSFEILEQAGDSHLVFDDAAQVCDVDTLLLHGVAVAESDGVVFQSLVVNSHAERSADGILTTVALANLILLLILAVEVELQSVDNLTSLLLSW